MPIFPLKSEVLPVTIGVWDLEWLPYTLGLRVGVCVSEKETFSAFTIEEVLDHMLQDKFVGTWWFAHAGGSYDFLFLLKTLYKRDNLRVTIAYSGSAIVRAEVSQGEKSWIFCDSFFLLRTSLRKIGQSLGAAKGGKADSTHMFYAPVHELLPYCIQDCKILYQAIGELADVLTQLGGELCPTIASCALKLFRRSYLAKTIRTDKAWNTTLRKAYVASRVEPFRRHGENLFQWDINSSFPFSMTFPQPGSKGNVGKKLPTKEGQLFFADVTVTIPNQHIPPLPYRIAHRVYFPTGTWRQWYSDVDVRLAEQYGRVEKVHKVISYDTSLDLKAYVDDVYARRKNTQRPFEKDVFKLLLNALYGKFGERSMKESMHLRPADLADIVSRRGEEIVPGLYRVLESQDVKHEHVCMSARITALSRRWIFEYLVDAHNAGGSPYYCDTDCIVTSLPEVKNMGDELGQVKLEGDKPIGRFDVYAPKFYIRDGKVKAKGFSRLQPGGFAWVTQQSAEFEDLRLRPLTGIVRDEKTGEDKDIGDAHLDDAAACAMLQDRRPAVAIGRMDRSKGMLRRFQVQKLAGEEGDLDPRLITVAKTLNFDGDLAKRRFFDNESEPYDVEDLKTRHPEG